MAIEGDAGAGAEVAAACTDGTVVVLIGRDEGVGEGAARAASSSATGATAVPPLEDSDSRTKILAPHFLQRMVRIFPRTFSSEIWYFVRQLPQRNFIPYPAFDSSLEC
ncbi:MAG: hypothetical protein AAGK78_11005 [Planctomycetota bacterium]